MIVAQRRAKIFIRGRLAITALALNPLVSKCKGLQLPTSTNPIHQRACQKI